MYTYIYGENRKLFFTYNSLSPVGTPIGNLAKYLKYVEKYYTERWKKNVI
jgi:hypothetical protein